MADSKEKAGTTQTTRGSSAAAKPKKPATKSKRATTTAKKPAAVASRTTIQTTAKTKRPVKATPKDKKPQPNQADIAFGATPTTKAAPDSNTLLSTLTTAMLTEQRAARRWKITLRLLWFTLIAFITVSIYTSDPIDNKLSAFSPSQQQQPENYVAVVRVNGVIAQGTEADAERIIDNLNQALESKGTQAVLLDINSPGGSPVQSARVYREILRLRELHADIPIHAVIGDLGASGAYYIAAATENIYADPSSIVGSIGVIYSGFGFTGAMEKVGIERRVITAGSNKANMDPFSPNNPQHKVHWQRMLNNVHQQFINDVRTGRPKLASLNNNSDVFSGLVYTGNDALELGLVDSWGDLHSIARDEIGVPELVVFDQREERWLNLVQRFASSMLHATGIHSNSILQ